tara:strand:- start:105 stop:548 length:444 start_codon:yes stop_codon:yes gene_type:complete
LLTPDDLVGCYPVRNEISWGYDIRRGPATGEGRVAILFTPKNFGWLERLVHKILGGSKFLRRPMDPLMTVVWELCDGQHNFEQICAHLDIVFKEEIAPVEERTCTAIDGLGRSSLIEIHRDKPVVNHKICSHRIPEHDFEWLHVEEE